MDVAVCETPKKRASYAVVFFAADDSVIAAKLVVLPESGDIFGAFRASVFKAAPEGWAVAQVLSKRDCIAHEYRAR